MLPRCLRSVLRYAQLRCSPWCPRLITRSQTGVGTDFLGETCMPPAAGEVDFSPPQLIATCGPLKWLHHHHRSERPWHACKLQLNLLMLPARHLQAASDHICDASQLWLHASPSVPAGSDRQASARPGSCHLQTAFGLGLWLGRVQQRCSSIGSAVAPEAESELRRQRCSCGGGAAAPRAALRLPKQRYSTNNSTAAPTTPCPACKQGPLHVDCMPPASCVP